jgi:hypothetical protein
LPPESLTQAVTTRQGRRDRDNQLKKVLSQAIERGRTDIVWKYVDFAASAILLDAEPIARWHSETTPIIKSMT